MIKTIYFSLLRYNKFEFGNQFVSQFVIFECKWLFSIILFYFHKSDGAQDRFHTHAFNAISFKLFGCATILISGPWLKEWKEYVNGRTQVYTWGRKAEH